MGLYNIESISIGGNTYKINQDVSDKAPLVSPAFTGTPTAPTAAEGTNTTQIATTAFVMNAFTANDAMLFKGTIGSSGATVTALPANHKKGWTYKVATAGTYAGQACEIGDMIICVTNGTSANDAHWAVVQTNVDGAVTGPASSTDAHVAIFNGTSGKVIKDGTYTIGKSVPSNAVFTDTDTKVTSAANHYTPSRDTSADKSASASGATAAWSIDVVKGVTVQTDGKGHVTGVAVTSGKIPSNPNTDTHRVIKVDGTQALASNTTALDLKSGSNVTITDGGSGAITIAATDTTYSAATQSADGLMSSTDKTKLDGIAAGATANAGTVTSVATGTGLTGGTITGSGTLKAALTSETKLTNAAADGTEMSGRVYPVRVDKNGNLAGHGPWTDNNTNTTSPLTQDSTDGHKITLTPSSGSATTITIPDNNTTYESKSAASGGTAVSLVTTGEKYTWNNKASTSTATQSANGLMSSTDKTKLDGIASGATANTGTITGIKMNGASKGTSGVVDLGTVITSHQDISGKANLASPTFTGTPKAPTAAEGTNDTQIATTAFVMNAFKANDAMIFKGTIGSSGATVTELPTTHYQGWTYRVLTAGVYVGKTCEIGDMIICVTDGTSANDDHWTVVQTNIDGAVTGPASSTDAHVVTFNGTSGKVIKDSGFTIGKSVPSNAVFTDTNTKVTSAANHYAPVTSSGNEVAASASGATAAWSIDVVKGVSLDTDGKGHVTGINVTSGKIPANPNTDTKVTSAANHYAPSTASGSDVTASATGATASWSIDVVKGVTLNTDGKGHVTGMSVTSGKIPANPNTDTHRVIKVNGTQALASNTTALNLIPGSNVSITDGGSGAITIAATDTTYSTATQSVDGLMSSTDKTKLDGIASGATANTGTVTKVSTGAGLTGGDVTTTGTVKANLVSETKLINAASAATETSGRVYPVALDKNGKLAVNVPWTDNNTNTTYTLTQDSTDGHKITLTPSSGSATTITIPDNNTTYESKTAASGGTAVSLVTTGEKYTWNNKASTSTATQSANGLMSSTDKTKLDGIASGATANTGTITGIKMNGASKGTSGVVDLGTVITSHQDISGKANLASPTFTGTPKAPTAAEGTNDTQIATTAFVMNAFKANDAMVFKGTIGSSGATVTALPDTHYQGWTYRVLTAGTYAGKVCEIGDMIICVTDGTSANNDHWTVVQTNIDGAVTGPASSTDAHVAVFDGASGKVIKDGTYTIGKSVPSNAVFTDTNTKVTSAANHYAPSTASGSDVTASATGATAAWSIDVVKGVTLNTDGKGHVTGMSVTSGKIPANPNTDTMVTSAANHYAPTTSSGSEVAASASGATAAWSIDVVKGVSLDTDGKGHVTGISVTSGKIPANPNTDTHRVVKVNGTQALASNTTALNLIPGSNVSITDGGSGAITIAATDTTYSGATQSADGLMSSSDKTKLDGIASGATANTGTVTKVSTGAGLTGGDITTTGTVKAALTSETKLTNAAADGTETSGRVYPVRLDKNGKLAVNVPWTDNNTTYTFDGTYNASTNKAATVSTVTNAIAALDGNLNSTTPGAGKTLTAFSETDGVVSATFGDISITKSQVSDFPTSMTPTSHTHGNIQNGGTLQTNDIAIASGDKLIVTDSSDSSKIARTSISFDGSTTTQALTKKGTWGTFLTSHQDISGKAPLASPALTGTPTAPTAADGTNTTQIATTAFVMNAFKANDAMIFKGTIGSSGATVTALPDTHYQGWTYRVLTAGTYAGKACEIGDMVICVTDGTSANNDHWTVVQTNIDGAVTGPVSSTDAHVATFNGTSGKVIKDSGFTIGKSVPSNAVFTDTNTAVTSAANHYAPSRDTNADKSASATGATAAWSIDVVKGVTVQTDGKGHVTGVAVTSGKIPANPNTDTSVTSSANHYTPSTASGSDVSASATGATAAWSIDVVKGVTLNTDGKGHVTGMSVTSGKIPTNPNTDTKVTSAANHYTPSTASGSDVTASATGATAAWSIDVVKGVTLNTDGKGHVTGLSVTSGKIPANPNTDTHRVVKVNGTQALASNTTALNLIAGSNVSITDGGSGAITIAATDTTYSTATTSVNGLMSSSDKTKVDNLTAMTTSEIASIFSDL